METLQPLTKLFILNIITFLPLCLCHAQTDCNRQIPAESDFIVEYIELLESLSDTTSIKESIHDVLSRVQEEDTATFEKFVSSMEHYLCDADSQMRNEELYIYVLQFIVENDKIANIDKLRAKYQLGMALKNRVGSVAADFKYITKSGNESSMHSIDSKYLLLFFNSPDCKDCKRLKRQIANSRILKDLYHNGLLNILAIDVESDNHKEIISESLYNLQAIPSLYLLDSHKRVILKECSLKEIELYL